MVETKFQGSRLSTNTGKPEIPKCRYTPILCHSGSNEQHPSVQDRLEMQGHPGRTMKRLCEIPECSHYTRLLGGASGRHLTVQ